MNLSEFDYGLPEDLIAQEPMPERDASRLMVLDRKSGAVQHRVFSELPSLLQPGDLVVLNDTRVLPARLVGRKTSGGRIELLLVSLEEADRGTQIWRCLVAASSPPKPGAAFALGQGFFGEVLAQKGGTWRVRLTDVAGDPQARIESLGLMPVPPYIRRAPEDPNLLRDRERYQTVFARHTGAIAAPTAGLHFTAGLFRAMKAAGARLGWVTLHVGLGTFQPIRVDQVEEHRMHEEAYDLPESTAAAVEETRRAGGSVIAVGTTVVRVLESRATETGTVMPGSGWCDLFIVPGHRFRVVDALVTNFHLPRSTLLLLVSAFAGRERVLAAYEEAIRQSYRFYSYGDAMFVRPG